MINVTRQNFAEIAPKFRKAIDECDFVSLDCEFSGINSSDKNTANYLDDYETYYQKVKKNVQKLEILQIGISTTRYERKTKKYVTDVYNFNIFSSDYFSNGSFITFQSSSIRFLAQNRYDFNECLLNGIEFLSIEKFNKYQDFFKFYSHYKEFLRSIFAKECYGEYPDIKQNIQKWLDSDNKDNLKFTCKRSDGHYLTGVLMNISNDFSSKLELNIYEDEITLIKSTKNFFQLEEYFKILHDLLLRSYGFGDLIDHLIKSKKPIVGHYLFYDLMFVHEKFIRTLPDTFSEFKNSLNKEFPSIYDTKYIISQSLDLDKGFKKLSFTNLETLFWFFKDYKNDKIDIPGVEHSMNNINFHNAGHDAFSIIFVFIHLMCIHASVNIKKLSDHNNSFRYLMSGLKMHQNFIYIGLNLKYTNLLGDDELKSPELVIKIADARKSCNISKELIRTYFRTFSGRVIENNGKFIVEAKKERIDEFVEKSKNLNISIGNGKRIFGKVIPWNYRLFGFVSSFIIIPVVFGITLFYQR